MLCCCFFFIDHASAVRATLLSEQLSRGTVEEKGQSEAGCCQGQDQACGDGGCCSTSRQVGRTFPVYFLFLFSAKVMTASQVCEIRFQLNATPGAMDHASDHLNHDLCSDAGLCYY